MGRRKPRHLSARDQITPDEEPGTKRASTRREDISDWERAWDLGGLGTFPRFDPGEIGTVWVCLVEQHTRWLRDKTFTVWGGVLMIGAP